MRPAAAHPLPANTMMGIPSEVGRLRACGLVSGAAIERGRRANRAANRSIRSSSDMSVGALVRSRLGDEVADRLVEPLLGGVYAGRADELSVRATTAARWPSGSRDGGSLVDAARAVDRRGDP